MWDRDPKGRYTFWHFDGAFWDVPTQTYVVDDFGNLVEVDD